MEMVVSPYGSAVAWVISQYGIENIWHAAAPSWEAQQLTRYSEDDGQELTSLRFVSAAKLIYVRGGDHHSNWAAEGKLQPNPSSSVNEPKLSIYVLQIAECTSTLLAEGDYPESSPDGTLVAYIKDDAIWFASLNDGNDPARLFFAKGKCGDIRWSPDSTAIAFVNSRGNHAYVGIYRKNSGSIQYLSPSTNWDTTPRWSPDGKRIAFIRTADTSHAFRTPHQRYPDTWSILAADSETNETRVLTTFTSDVKGYYPRMQWGAWMEWASDDKLVFRSDYRGSYHLYKLDVHNAANSETEPLTSGNFEVEDAAVAPAANCIYFSANSGSTPDDIDRRRIWKLDISSREANLINSGWPLEFNPLCSKSGTDLIFLGGSETHPVSPYHLDQTTGKTTALFSGNPFKGGMTENQLVKPKSVLIRSEDGLEIHCQRFEAESRSTDKKPALVFVHGGPSRQMLLGWHNMGYYSNAYAVNQYFAARGYVVLSVNYRLGTGYGSHFQYPDNAGACGAAEYRDVLAAGSYLCNDPAVDASKIGIWGGSYGGYLTAMALAKNSEMFRVGVDYCGVHDWSRYLKAAILASQSSVERPDFNEKLKLAWESSPMAHTGTWKSPVLLIHGDDDRNVDFGHTVELAARLLEKGVEVEELIFPDDTHALKLWKNNLTANLASIKFLRDRLG